MFQLRTNSQKEAPIAELPVREDQQILESLAIIHRIWFYITLKKSITDSPQELDKCLV